MMKRIALFLALAGCAPVANVVTSPATVAAPGRLVIVGGALSAENSAVYRSILEARQGSGPFCVFPTAGAMPDSNMASPVATFNKHGGPGTAIGVLVSSLKPETARDPNVVAQIKGCSGFFFIGGVQSRVIAAFRPQGNSTPAYEALMQRWREGAVVSGSSAGAAIMSDPMIAGGTSLAAMQTGIRRIGYIGADADDTTGGVTMAPGLGLFRAALADQHFLARGRFGRLLTAMIEMNEFDLAFGIDENTALVVDRDSLRVVGASAVVVFDERSAKRSGRSVSDITMHLLGDGDRFDLRSRTPSFTGKFDLAPSTASEVKVENAFARLELLRALDAFAGTSDTTLVMPFDGGRVEIRKQRDYWASRLGSSASQAGPRGLGMTGLRLDILR